MESIEPTPLESYNKLLKLYKDLQKDHEIQTQELYDANRKLKTANTLEKEYVNEIEVLQFDLSNVRKGFEEKITHLEETIATIRGNHDQQVTTLESELANRDTLIKDLEFQTEVLKKVNAIDKSTIEIDDNSNEYCDLREKILNLENKLEEAEGLISSLQENVLNLQGKIGTLEEENECLKETVNIKKDDLMQAHELIRTLQDEALCHKSELDALRNVPLEKKSKGNSLFAEVDDRRVKLQGTMNSIKREYISIKQEHSSLVKQISYLRKENAILCAKWKADVVDKASDTATLEDSYKTRIKYLEIIIDNFKQEIANKNKLLAEVDSENFQAARGLIVTISNKSDSLRDELRVMSTSKSFVDWKLRETQQDLRKYRIQAKLFELELQECKALLKENNIEAPSNDFFNIAESIVQETELKENKTKKAVVQENVIPSEENRPKKLNGQKVLGDITFKENETKKLEVIEVKKNLFATESKPVIKKENLFIEEETKPVIKEENSFVQELKPVIKKEELEIISNIKKETVVQEERMNSLDTIIIDDSVEEIVQLDDSSPKRISEEIKENIPNVIEQKVKRVQFSKDTVEPKTTIRRPGIITKTSVHFSTLMSKK